MAPLVPGQLVQRVDVGLGARDDDVGVRHLGDLPTDAQNYVRRVEELLGARVDMISVGPERSQAIVTRDIFGAALG